MFVAGSTYMETYLVSNANQATPHNAVFCALSLLSNPPPPLYSNRLEKQNNMGSPIISVLPMHEVSEGIDYELDLANV